MGWQLQTFKGTLIHKISYILKMGIIQSTMKTKNKYSLDWSVSYLYICPSSIISCIVAFIQCCCEKCVHIFVMMLHCPQSKNRGAKYNQHDRHLWVQSEESGLKDLLRAADLVPCVKVFQVEEVEQHLRHVLILIDDVLANERTTQLVKFDFWSK